MSKTLHEWRPKHGRHMAAAKEAVEKSNFHVKEANRYLKGMSVDYADAAKRHAMSGFDWVTVAIREVVDCGCPRSLWPEEVQERILEHIGAWGVLE